MTHATLHIPSFCLSSAAHPQKWGLNVQARLTSPSIRLLFQFRVRLGQSLLTER